MVPPFSVLNARDGWWQDRKRAWIGLGIKSEVGRGGNLLRMSDTVLDPDGSKGLNPRVPGASKAFNTEGNATEATGTSIFDPVLAELSYLWFCPPGEPE